VNVFIPPDEGLFDSLPAAVLVQPVVPPVLDTLVADSLQVPQPGDTVPGDSTPDTAADSTRDSTPHR